MTRILPLFVKGVKYIIPFVMAYDGRVFDKPRMIAMLDRADAVIARAEGG